MNQHRLGHTVYQRLKRARYKAQGRCQDCGQKASRGTTRCFRHALYQARWFAKRRAA